MRNQNNAVLNLVTVLFVLIGVAAGGFYFLNMNPSDTNEKQAPVQNSSYGQNSVTSTGNGQTSVVSQSSGQTSLVSQSSPEQSSYSIITCQRNSEGNPVVYWDNSDPQTSFDEMAAYVSDLEDKVVIVGKDKNLEWEDVCMELFWVDSFSISSYEGSDEKTYIFKYKPDAAENKVMQQKIDAEVKDIISLIPSGTDDWNKILIVHDELVRRVTYNKDSETIHCHDIYGALGEHVAVCQGYTYSMSYIAKRLNMPCSEISSDTHIWNVMPGFQTDECYIDTTWDDIGSYDADGNPYILHDYFGLKKYEMESLSEHEPKDVKINVPTKGIVGDNYFRKKGWYISSGDSAQLEIAVKEQLTNGGNMIELRFEDPQDFVDAPDNVNSLLRDIGYVGRYLSWKSDDLLIFEVGLNP